MFSFLKQPNLPEARVALCALASGSPHLVAEIKKLGVKVLEIPPHPMLPGPVCRHVDLQLHPLGGADILVPPGLDESIKTFLIKQKFSVKESSITLNSQYPGDIPLCCFRLGDTLFCLPEKTAPEILSRAGHIEPVRQGYARCSTCIVDKNSIITADVGIAAAARSSGVAVLQIRPGHIALPGYDDGLIGGCCGLLDRGLLAFTGSIDTHPDAAAIRSFCRERGVELHCLQDGPLLDIGGIIPLQQQPVQSSLPR